MPPITTVVDLLRHGEVLGGRRFRGRTDDALTETGWAQMQQQTDNLQWDAVISSPARRCLDFASDWSRRQHCPLHVESGWQEIDFGAWDGLTAEQIEQRYPGCLEMFYADPDRYTPPGGEPYRDFAGRIGLAWDKLLAAFPGQTLLVVTHGGVIRVLFSQLLSMTTQQSLQIDIPHACLTRFTSFDEANNRFVQFNFHKPA